MLQTHTPTQAALYIAKIPKTLTNIVSLLKNLEKLLTMQDLREICEKFGTIERVAIQFDPGSFKSKGCAFVTFANTKEAMEAIQVR